MIVEVHTSAHSIYLLLMMMAADVSCTECAFSLLCCELYLLYVSLITAPPIIFVIIGLTTVLDEYVVYFRNDAGEILTDSAGNGMISL